MKASQLRVGDQVAVGNHKDGLQGYCELAVVVELTGGHKVGVSQRYGRSDQWEPRNVATQSIVGMWEDYEVLQAEKKAKRDQAEKEWEERKALKVARNNKINEALKERGIREIMEDHSDYVSLGISELMALLNITE